MSTEPPRERDPVPRFIGWLLLVVGVLWMASAGLCTIGMLVQTGVANGADASMLVLFAVIGLAAFVAGFGVFMLGRALARN